MPANRQLHNRRMRIRDLNVFIYLAFFMLCLQKLMFILDFHKEEFMVRTVNFIIIFVHFRKGAKFLNKKRSLIVDALQLNLYTALNRVFLRSILDKAPPFATKIL
jgi:hypothetical protein